MGELVERYVRPVARSAVDWLVGGPRGWSGSVVVGLYGAIVVAAALYLGGVLPPLGPRVSGPLPVTTGAAPSSEVGELARRLRFESVDGAHDQPLADVSQADPATRAWLDAQVCAAWGYDHRQRQARAWRLEQNPGLCGPALTALGRAPLVIALGWIPGVALSVAILALLAAPMLLLLLWLRRVRAAYGRLYVSDHRRERLGTAEAP